MANQRLYLVFTPDEGPPTRVLLAKGWANGWELSNADKLKSFFSDCTDAAAIGPDAGDKVLRFRLELDE